MHVVAGGEPRLGSRSLNCVVKWGLKGLAGNVGAWASG